MKNPNNYNFSDITVPLPNQNNQQSGGFTLGGNYGPSYTPTGNNITTTPNLSSYGIIQLPGAPKTNVPANTTPVVPSTTPVATNTQPKINTGTSSGNYNTGTPTPTSPTTTPPVPGSVASIMYNGTTNPDQNAIDSANSILTNTTYETDPNKIYQQNLANYQAQIDAINAMYADQLNQARIQGQGRLGSTTALNARSGLLGSDIGQANTNRQQDANTQVYNSIENERNAAIQGILSGVRSEALSIAQKNTEARKAGAEKTLQFLNVDKPALKAKLVSNAVKSLVAQGITDISGLSSESLNSFLTGLGVSKDEFISALSSEKAASVKAAADLAKEKKYSFI
jgi:hypothetical protein